ncbi:hypothetical protein ACFOUP_08430 [Belliella kenyensis]|uniref:Uncharacterized protein n=1 Tax=Belliella kenyensis TaxID=1472724 RepID=A0ABV8EM18_9BACT|nr:hypothetical protein [Belliella kenyensis]MCH7403912.1 hypothetical protein [Belliella kenyensis]MDN3603435.1 hypothetical protein [Belliella kenyensis]
MKMHLDLIMFLMVTPFLGISAQDRVEGDSIGSKQIISEGKTPALTFTQMFFNKYMGQLHKGDIYFVESNVTISFGEKISENTVYNVSEDTSWKIHSNDEIVESGFGVSINDKIFDQPGAYTVKVYTPHRHVPGGCNHADEEYLINVKVDPIKYEWIWDENEWYDFLSSKKQFNQDTIKVPVNIHTIEDKTLDDNPLFQLRVSGIDCDFSGTGFLNGKYLTSNQNPKFIDFNVSGTIGDDVYVQVDLINPNGQTESFTILKQIK